VKVETKEATLQMQKVSAIKDQIRVLVVDDHPVVRKGLQSCLARQSRLKIVGEAADGDEALKLTRQLTPDVVLLDLDMPRLNGLTVAEFDRMAQDSRTRSAILEIENRRWSGICPQMVGIVLVKPTDVRNMPGSNVITQRSRGPVGGPGTRLLSHCAADGTSKCSTMDHHGRPVR